jgi:carbonic anhydrase/acetyltransferase-like protein (isoleucine patch superfamily)
MSPPEVWGPAVWLLFHSLIEQLNPSVYEHVIGSMFRIIVRICKYLPCPDCSADASKFLARIHLRDYKTKIEFKNMLYLFHNWVNVKKRKPLYNYSHLEKYSRINIVYVLNNFISKYNTKGNMKLLNESFQRSFVVKELVSWFKTFASAFVQKPQEVAVINEEQPVTKEESIDKNEAIVEEQPVIKEESIDKEQPIVEEHQVVEEQLVIKEESIVEDQPIKEECIVDDQPVIKEESIVEDQPIKEECIVDEQPIIKEESVIEESIVDEEPIIKEKSIVLEKPVIEEQSIVEEEETNSKIEETMIVENNDIQQSKKKRKSKSKK